MTALAERQQATPAEVRAWARRHGYTVGVRGHMPQAVVDAFNRGQRRLFFRNSNPMAQRLYEAQTGAE